MGDRQFLRHHDERAISGDVHNHMTHPPFFARVATAFLVVASTCAKVRGQDYSPPVDLVPIAVTYCHTSDSTARAFTVTFINVSLMGTDSLDEVLVHERAHDRMNRDSLRLLGHCPGPIGDARAQLEREVYAYCVSDSVRVARTKDASEAGHTTVVRLMNQFNGRLPAPLIARIWSLRCPRYAWGVE